MYIERSYLLSSPRRLWPFSSPRLESFFGSPVTTDASCDEQVCRVILRRARARPRLLVTPTYANHVGRNPHPLSFQLRAKKSLFSSSHSRERKPVLHRRVPRDVDLRVIDRPHLVVRPPLEGVDERTRVARVHVSPLHGHLARPEVLRLLGELERGEVGVHAQSCRDSSRGGTTNWWNVACFGAFA